MGIGFEVSRLSVVLLLPSGTGTDVETGLDLGSPVPRRTEWLPSLTEIDTTADEAVGIPGESTCTGAVVAIDPSSPPDEIAASADEVGRVITGELDGRGV